MKTSKHKNLEIFILAFIGLSLSSFARLPGHFAGENATITQSSTDQQFQREKKATKHHFAGYRFVGELEIIDTDETPYRLVFKNLKESSYGRLEVVKLCDVNESDNLSLGLWQKMRFYQEAQKSKQKLDVSIKNLFDRCVLDITTAQN